MRYLIIFLISYGCTRLPASTDKAPCPEFNKPYQDRKKKSKIKEENPQILKDTHYQDSKIFKIR